MPTLESRRLLVLGEVSCVIAKETEQGVTITLSICAKGAQYYWYTLCEFTFRMGRIQ